MQLLKKNIDKIISEKYLAYAISTIVSRSLPDLRDGLKPVHRRIIYSMYQLKLLSGSQFKKSARIVGDVMGKFHPHGDQAIYDSLVRLAQNFSTRIPLVEGQGNFGNIDGDNAAAMRYTEARLDIFSNFFFDGIEEDAVDFRDNYDGQNLEPVVLPSKIPNILINGSSGIAVGMATNIPPHNIFDLNKCIIKLIQKPDIGVNNLIKIINGPDLPTGGEIYISPSEKNEIYKNGKGSFTISSKYHIEKLKNSQYQIIITEIPFQVNKTRLIENIALLINNKKIPLDDVSDESDELIRLVLKPKNRNIDPFKLVKLCFKLSDLSIKFSCNFNVLIDGVKPKLLGIKEILNQFINFRFLTIKRHSNFNIKKIQNRLEILIGFLIAYKFLDQIIKIIRTKENPKKEIISKFNLTEIQASSILNMRLGSLKKLDEIDTKKEIKNLEDRLKFLKKLVNNSKFLNQFLINEILEINQNLNTFRYKRKTKIYLEESKNEDISFYEFQQVDKLTVVMNNDGSLKVYRDHIDFTKLNKDKDKDKILSLVHTMSNKKCFLFTSSGRVFTINPNDLPSGKAYPKNFIYFTDASINDKIISLFPENDNFHYVVASQKGKGFIADIKNIKTNQKKGKQLFNLKKDDKLIKVLCLNHSHIACVNNLSKLLIFETKQLPVLQKGMGVQMQKIKENDFLSDFQLFNIDDGLSWYKGKLKRNEKNLKLWLGKRSQFGKKLPKKFNKDLKFHEKYI